MMDMSRTEDARRTGEKPAPRSQRREKIYVKVNSDFDTTGYMQPRTITWTDGQSYRIDRVKDFRPAASVGAGCTGDCYTVVIAGRERHLFFERTDPLFTARIGRWFIEARS